MNSSHTPASEALGAATPGRTFDLYAEITQQITAMLDSGVVPWARTRLNPKNLDSKKPYRGVNVFLLAFTAFAKGYCSSYWLTLRQANALKGAVRKGEKSTMVIFWKKAEVEDRQTREKKEVLVARYYRVFNVEQCEGIQPPDAVPFTPTNFKPIEEAEKLIKGYTHGPAIQHGGRQAFYRPSTDTIKIPEPTRFSSGEEFYATLLHEESHSTGHSKRLNRELDAKLKPFGSPDYGREELIAEMSAAFLCGQAGISPAVITNQAAYISGWLGRIREDRKLIIQAAAAEQRAADWIRGLRYADTSEPANPQATSAAEVPAR